MTRTHRRTTDERSYAAAQDTITAERARAPPAKVDDLEPRRNALPVGLGGHDQRRDAAACLRPSRAVVLRPDPA